MNVTIRENFTIELYGFSDVVADEKWADAGMKLMNQLWQEVRAHKLDNAGMNVWVYEPGYALYTGVELRSAPPSELNLELKKVSLPKYAYYKHVGSYDKIPASFSMVKEQLGQMGVKFGLPYLEIYGHWTEDTAKLETELLWQVE